ncbi:AEC family transporter [Microbacterium aquimaris]|uniref:AEC family transporter n=1 Tax=Microbacterium aquimaris TaxID=459816 RepID=UPI002AD2694E|nr:AEC family transporter [Microbacterium aquimaris]MDZ8276082.1 AEC family transporter [Microbacterium aquimaris]
MLESLTGFVVVGVAIAVGYIIARVDLLGEHARPVLARLTFFVLSPFLLFVVLAEADVRTLFSALLPVSAIAAAVAIGAYALVARLVWRRSVGETTIGALGAGQVNSNNIGIPLSVYLLGSAAYPAPVILLQLLVLTPITMAIFESVTAQRRSAGRILLRTVTNPLVIGSTLGTMVAVSGLQLPAVAMEPVRLIADACVPVLLISYGMSLFGQRVLSASGRRRDVLLATALKLLVMPLTAWAIAEFVFGMTDHEVLVVVVLAALPTAQNVFNYSQRFGIGETISRDTVFLTTVGCVPILFAATLLWG